MAPTDQNSRASLWVAPVAASGEPLPEAKLDNNVTIEQIRAAVEKVKARANAFVRPVPKELLHADIR